MDRISARRASGDRVALYLENCGQLAVAHFGALKAGAITACLSPMRGATELQHELEDSPLSGKIVKRALRVKARGLPPAR